MSLLKNAYMRILHHCIYFAEIKRAKVAGDILKVIRFERQTEDNLAEVIQIKDSAHVCEMKKDPNIAKLYYSENMLGPFKYLAFIQLGIEYLIEHAEHKSAHEGRKILALKIIEERKELHK